MQLFLDNLAKTLYDYGQRVLKNGVKTGWSARCIDFIILKRAARFLTFGSELDVRFRVLITDSPQPLMPEKAQEGAVFLFL